MSSDGDETGRVSWRARMAFGRPIFTDAELRIFAKHLFEVLERITILALVLVAAEKTGLWYLYALYWVAVFILAQITIGPAVRLWMYLTGIDRLDTLPRAVMIAGVWTIFGYLLLIGVPHVASKVAAASGPSGPATAENRNIDAQKTPKTASHACWRDS